jgi:hypothetical protein
MSAIQAYRDDGPIAVLLSRLVRVRVPASPLGWLVVPILRVAEYVTIAVVGLHTDASEPVIFALLGALAFHHYDTVYRVRQGLYAGTEPTAALRLAGFGWDGRLLVTLVAALTGTVPEVFAVGTAYLWVVFAADSLRGWLRPGATAGEAVDLEEVPG